MFLIFHAQCRNEFQGVLINDFKVVIFQDSLGMHGSTILALSFHTMSNA